VSILRWSTKTFITIHTLHSEHTSMKYKNIHNIWCYFCSSLQLLLQQHSLFLLNYSRSRLFLHCRKCYLKKKPLSVILVISMKLEVSVLWSGLIFMIFQETGWRFMWEKKKRMFQTIFQNFFLSIFLIHQIVEEKCGVRSQPPHTSTLSDNLKLYTTNTIWNSCMWWGRWVQICYLVETVVVVMVW
jgi:hypothetical protein